MITKEKLQNGFNKLSPTLGKIGNNKYLLSISSAMMRLLGPIILGSFATIGAVYLSRVRIVNLANLCMNVNTITIGCISLYVVFLIAQNVASKFTKEDNGVSAGIIALMCFLIMTPMGKIKAISAIPTSWLSSNGMFSAIIIGLIVGKVYALIKNKGLVIKMPSGVPPMVSSSFTALIPAILLGLAFFIISFLFTLTPFGSFHQMIFSIIQTPLSKLGGSLPAMLLFVLISQLLFFFGIHGPSIIAPIITPIYMSMDMQNLKAYQLGKALPNAYGLTFYQIATWGGSILGLVLLMLFFAKSKRFKTLSKIALIPALFGIGEPVIFGAPIMLNFDFAFPYITNKMISVALSALLTKIGLVAKCTGAQTVWGLPVGFIALAGGSASIVIWHLIFQLIVSPLLWYPWFKIADNRALSQEK